MISGDNSLGAAATALKKILAAADGRIRKSGTDGRMSGGREKRVRAFGALLISALALGGCSISIADLPLAGTPADAPARPKETGAYLPVNELPPNREEAAMNPAERAKIQSELVAARERQATATAAKDAAAK
jgi:hypothetical protein